MNADHEVRLTISPTADHKLNLITYVEQPELWPSSMHDYKSYVRAIIPYEPAWPDVRMHLDTLRSIHLRRPTYAESRWSANPQCCRKMNSPG